MYEVIIGRSPTDVKKYGLTGTILLGRHYVKMGRTTSLSNKVFLDVSGAHVYFICGKRGGGKCLHGDTLITLEDGSRVPIKKLKNNTKKVFALDKNKMIISSKMTKFYERKVTKLLKITLKSRKSIKLTPEHPLYTAKGWVPAEQLKKGVSIATTKKDKKTGYALFWDEIISIKPLEGKFEVYDLTVPKHHNFVANDIIVHNSYTMGVIAEGMAGLPKNIKNNLSFVLLDTMGIYWTMKYPNKQDKLLLDEWGLAPSALDIVIYTPKGYFKEFREKGIPTDYPFAIKPSELDAKDWCTTFVVDPNSALGVMIESVIYKMKEESDNYTVDDIIDVIKKDNNSTKESKDAAINRFLNAKNWGIFDVNATPLRDIVKGGQVTVLDVSCYATLPGGWEIKNLVIGLVSQKLFIERMVSRRDEEFKDIKTQMNYFYEDDAPKTLEDPLVWLVIDEAHEFLPREGKTLATDSLVTIMREGRQPGISLILATQQPGKIHTDVMTQSDVVISHRITAKIDTDALSALTQSYMREGLDKYLNELPAAKGSAIVLDDNNERIFPIKIRPRFTWHGGGSPFAVKEEKKIFEM